MVIKSRTGLLGTEFLKQDGNMIETLSIQHPPFKLIFYTIRVTTPSIYKLGQMTRKQILKEKKMADAFERMPLLQWESNSGPTGEDETVFFLRVGWYALLHIYFGPISWSTLRRVLIGLSRIGNNWGILRKN